jgi:beta-N-acetylhexosaminidase
VSAIPPTLIAETMVNLYGPQATDQVDPTHISSFSFSQLIQYMDLPPPLVVESEGETTPVPPPPVAVALERADWIVFGMLNISEQESSSNAVRRFLAEQGDLLRDKQSVVFAFGAPYYLDTTEIAKLSMYYGLYSHIDPFVETAVRALFDEFAVTGAAPVSIAGINYDLITQTQPDPAQIIELYVGDETADGTPQPAPQLSLGDAIRLRTSVIIDRNGHRVPDGTPVEFIFTYAQEGLELTIQKTTRDGIASTGEAEVILDRAGHLQISVRAEPAPRAVRLELDIPEGSPATIVSVAPSPEPSPPPSPLPTIAPTPEVTPAPEEEAEDDHPLNQSQGTVGWLDLGQTILAATAAALAGYVGIWLLKHSLSSALRAALCTTAGGMVGYIGLALGMPGFNRLTDSAAAWAPSAVTLVGSLVALLTFVLYEVVIEERRSRDKVEGS